MNTKLATLLLLITAVVPSRGANTPITATGYNADMVIENNTNHFAHAVSGGNINDSSYPAWFEAGLGGFTDGLPASRTFTSAAGTLFELQPYGTNGTPTSNALRLFDGASGTLTLATPLQLSSLSILATTASGGETVLPLLITFTDSSTLSTSYSAPEWGGPQNAIEGLGRSSTSGTTFNYNFGTGTSFGMHETLIDLSSTTKPIQSLTFTGASTFTTYTTTSVFGLSGTVVPEPSSAILLLSGALFCLRRRTLRTHERIA